MNDHSPGSPWICHLCDLKSAGESVACSVCYMTTCAQHLRHTSVFNAQTGLYELQPVCLACAAGFR